MTKLSIRLLIAACVAWSTLALANPVEHSHGERSHIHNLPVPQGIQHTHNGLPKGRLTSRPKEADEPNIPAQPPKVSSNSNEHIHGHLFHSHPLPIIGAAHQHGSGAKGRPLVNIADFQFKESVWASDDSRVESCALVFLSKGLSPKFNPYRDWSGYCNDIKDTKEFKIKAYKNYGTNGLFAYNTFEQDYARLINMRVEDYEGVLTSSLPATPSYSGSIGGSVHVRGYYRKNGTYVRSHTRRRRR